MADKSSAVMPRDRQSLTRHESTRVFDDPFGVLDRFANDMDRMFQNFGFGRSWLTPPPRQWTTPSLSDTRLWAPQIEVTHRNNELVVRADLPGLKRDDIKVDVTDDTITIHGERRQEQESERGGVYRSERSYGSFYRQIPVPAGAIIDQAKASFKDGVLEITMPAPPDQVTRGRRLDIKEGDKK